jgi:hypothetical protein
MTLIDQKTLREIVSYDKATGDFIWVKRLSPHSVIGKVAGSHHYTGYKYLRLFGKSYPQHRLAWLYEYGYIPDCEIDHINQNKSDNRLCNLRLATREENRQNTSTYKNNTSGKKGVHWHKGHKKWYARITVNGVRVSLGLFNDLNEASTAYQNAVKQLHSHRPTV